MAAIQKEIVKDVIKELNGLAFKTSEPYSEKAKIFFEDRYLEILKKLPNIKKNHVGLEIGLAGGVLAFILKKAFNLGVLHTLEHPVTCREYSQKYLALLRKSNIKLEPVDLRSYSLPWPDDFFDFVIFSEVIEHLVPSDIPNIIKEIKRTLKKNGWLLITTPNIASLLKRINLLLGKNPIEFDLILHEGATYGHIREYTIKEVVDIVQNQGLNIVEKSYFMIDAKRNIFTQVENISAKLFPFLANNLAVIVKKT